MKLLDAQPKNENAILLLKAADLIRTRGLAKHIREDDEGRMCIHGALAMATTGCSDWNGETRPPIHEFTLCKIIYDHMIENKIGGDAHLSENGLANWNNKADRTADEVISVLEGTAATVAAKELVSA